MTKNLLWLTCASSALLLTAGAAQAATATATAAATDTDQSASSVAELVVVAQHHETALQKIPVAVSVFTGAQRDVVGISSVQDVTNFAPGFTYDPGNVHAYIRGVGRQSINVTNDSRVATYEDEFYVYSAYELDKSSLFLSQEQIERGPQSVGGKEAAGGSIDLISVRPTDHPYGELRASVANFGTYNLEGAFSDQVAPGLDVRIDGYYHNQDQGFYNNVANGISEGNQIHEWYIEGSADWKPNDKTELYVRGFWSGWNNRGDAGARSGFSNGSWDETNLTDGNDYPGAALFVNPNYGYAALSPAAAAGRNPADPMPFGTTLLTPGILNNPSALNPNNFAAVLPRDVSLNDYSGIQANFSYDVTDGIQFKYIGGYQQYDYTLNYSEPDTDVTQFSLPGSSPTAVGGLNDFNQLLGNPAPGPFAGCTTCSLTGGPLAAGQVLPAAGPLVINPLVDLNYREDDGWWSHEVSLQSTDKSPFQWTVGLYYYQQHYINPISAEAPQQANFQNPDYVLPGALLSGSCAVAVPAFGGLCGFSPGVAAPANPNHYLFYQDYEFTYQDEAAYGQVAYAFNDQFKITANLRYTNDHKWGTEEARDVAFSSAVIDGLSPFFGSQTPSLDVTPAADAVTCPSGTGPAGSASCSDPTKLAKGVVSIGTINPTTGIMSRPLNGDTDAITGGAGLEYTPTNDIFMYARYSRGYEAMSFNAGFISANPETQPEFLNSYEVGYKQTFGRRLTIDLAAFYYDYDQFQVPLSVNVGGVTSSQFINVPKAESTGIELEADWTPTKDLMVSGSYSYDYTAILTGCTGSFSGTAFIAAPGALCVEDTNDPDAVSSQARPFPGQAAGVRVQSVKGDPLPDAPRNKIAVDVAYTWHFEPGALTLSGSFVWRDVQDGTVFNRTYDNAPSWDGVNLRATWKGPDDRYEVIGYVDNLFNSLQYEVGDGGGGLLGNATSHTTAAQGLDEVNVFTLAPPRTYGMEVRYKFF